MYSSTVMDYAVKVENLSKSFGPVWANKGISLDVRKGEILALLGENGSGKSTLVNMLSGIYAPETGSISIDGKNVSFTCPQDAIAAGVGMVHQHFKLIDVMTATENITLGEGIKKAGFFINKKKIEKKIQALIDNYGFELDLNKKIYSMSVSEKQTVEIVKMLYQGAKVLILDEPTAVLTPQETERLFTVLRRMRDADCSIIIITHKLNEVLSISNRVTILRKGTYIGTVETDKTSETELASMMIGEKVALEIPRVKCSKSKESVLCVKDLSMKCEDGEKLSSVDFDIFGGEILGVAGIVGSGQKELCQIITGLQKATSGSVTFEGKDLLKLNSLEIKKLGIRMNFVPEDRLGMGLAAGMDIEDNIILRSFDSGHSIFLDRKAAKEKTDDIVSRYRVRSPSVHSAVRQLSGGNIQKVLLGREIEMHPKLLIAAYPFRGLDIGATNNIIGLLNTEKQKGVAILLIGEDIDQICALSDRVMVMHAGSVMGIVNPEEVSKEEIGLMMMGKKLQA